MDSDNFLVRLIVNGIVGAFIGASMLGLAGYLLAGAQGFETGMTFGAVFGLVGGFSMLGTFEGAAWYTGTIRRYGEKRHADEDDYWA